MTLITNRLYHVQTDASDKTCPVLPHSAGTEQVLVDLMFLYSIPIWCMWARYFYSFSGCIWCLCVNSEIVLKVLLKGLYVLLVLQIY